MEHSFQKLIVAQPAEKLFSLTSPENYISECTGSRKRSLLSASLLTYSMVQSPSWEANWFAASQEIPRISRNPKVHYRSHKRLPPVSILDQPNPAHIPTSHLLEIHPNIIHPSTPRSPQWSPSLRFPHQDPIHPPPPLTHTRHMVGWFLCSYIFFMHYATLRWYSELWLQTWKRVYKATILTCTTSDYIW